jgi:hypothetical protein
VVAEDEQKNQLLPLPLFIRSFRRLYLIRGSVENERFAACFAALENNLVMAATGELIRLINYVDDINTTMRRIQASLYGMDADERKRLAESLRAADQRLRELLAEVEK